MRGAPDGRPFLHFGAESRAFGRKDGGRRRRAPNKSLISAKTGPFERQQTLSSAALVRRRGVPVMMSRILVGRMPVGPMSLKGPRWTRRPELTSKNLGQGGSDQAELSRLFLRVEAALTERRSGWPEMPGQAERAVEPSGMQACRSRPTRIAAHAINGMLVVIAWPVGAAVLLHALAFGADLAFSTRALALSGTGVGLLRLMGG